MYCFVFFPRYLILLKDVGESSIMQWLRESESQRQQLFKFISRLLSFQAPSAGNCIHIKIFFDDSLWSLFSCPEKTTVKEGAPSFFWRDSGSRTCCMNNVSIQHCRWASIWRDEVDCPALSGVLLLHQSIYSRSLKLLSPQNAPNCNCLQNKQISRIHFHQAIQCSIFFSKVTHASGEMI